MHAAKAKISINDDRLPRQVHPENGLTDPSTQRQPVNRGVHFVKFLQLVRDGMREPVREKWDPHWAPQTQLLAMFRRYIPIDLVGRLEAFTPAMAYVLEIGEVKRPIDLSVRFNEGPKPPYRLQEIMTPGILEALLDLYGEDVEHFGYGEAIKAAS